ncbi:MAG: recombinase family protein [Clostridia bacterium]|nr:recombinase family protein [Clostridia bacterium]
MRAVIYARYSSDNQTEASIEGQLRECMEYATYNDIQVMGNYIDRALSAKTDNRPEFQRMIKERECIKRFMDRRQYSVRLCNQCGTQVRYRPESRAYRCRDIQIV